MTPASKALDQYFTPPKLAAELIEAVTVENPLLVGDFAAGDGELLKAAVKKWPGIKCIAIDIDNNVIDKLTKNQEDWLVTCSDFLNDAERQSITILNEREGVFPLIILNPPFSCKGGTMQWTEIGGVRTQCSPALFFIVKAAAYLKDGGQLVAIVPFGLIQGEKDSIARELLQKHYGFEVVETYVNGGFAKCSPRTAIIRLTAGHSTHDKHNIYNNLLENESLINTNFVSIQRGRIPNNKLILEDTESQLPFIHTTNLQKNKVADVKRFANNKLEKFRGPGVLLPRVGRPRIDKIVLIESTDEFVISECLFMIECNSKKDAESIYQTLIDNWILLKNSHGGTCATFITIQSLKIFLQKLGFPVLDAKKTIRNKSNLIEKKLLKQDENYLSQLWNIKSSPKSLFVNPIIN